MSLRCLFSAKLLTQHLFVMLAELLYILEFLTVDAEAARLNVSLP